LVDQIEKNEISGACSTYGRQEKCIQGFGGIPEGKRPLGRAKLKWEDNIKMDLDDVTWGCIDWINMAQDDEGWRLL